MTLNFFFVFVFFSTVSCLIRPDQYLFVRAAALRAGTQYNIQLHRIKKYLEHILSSPNTARFCAEMKSYHILHVETQRFNRTQSIIAPPLRLHFGLTPRGGARVHPKTSSVSTLQQVSSTFYIGFSSRECA